MSERGRCEVKGEEHCDESSQVLVWAPLKTEQGSEVSRAVEGFGLGTGRKCRHILDGDAKVNSGAETR